VDKRIPREKCEMVRASEDGSGLYDVPTQRRNAYDLACRLWRKYILAPCILG